MACFQGKPKHSFKARNGIQIGLGFRDNEEQQMSEAAKLLESCLALLWHHQSLWKHLQGQLGHAPVVLIDQAPRSLHGYRIVESKRQNAKTPLPDIFRADAAILTLCLNVFQCVSRAKPRLETGLHYRNAIVLQYLSNSLARLRLGRTAIS